MSTILVTGATGFIGSHLLNALLKKNNSNIIITTQKNSNYWRINKCIKNIKIFNIDSENIEKLFQENNVNIIVHLACRYGKSNQNLTEIIDTNIIFGLKILNLAIKYNVETFINTDTFFNNEKANLNYMGSYILSKKHFAEWFQLINNIKVINLKLHHVYGPRDNHEKFVPWLISQLKLNKDKILLSSGNQYRDFIYIDDVISAYLKVIDERDQIPNRSEYEIRTGNITTVKNFVELVKKLYIEKDFTNKSKLCFGEIEDLDSSLGIINSNYSQLIKLGWSVQFSLEDGIKKTIEENS